VEQGLPHDFTLANLKWVLAECIFRVTGGHSQVRIAVIIRFILDYRLCLSLKYYFLTVRPAMPLPLPWTLPW
jgi:hypothetical protein